MNMRCTFRVYFPLYYHIPSYQFNAACVTNANVIRNDLTVHVLTCRYESAEVALNCGMMLRECLRHEPLARTVLFSEDFYCFFHYVELSTFDIASDAFASFKVHCHIFLLFLQNLYMIIS